jgi:SAM-dependent methyltransferase
MIRVLEGWSEIGEANKSLARSGLPRHQTAEKNWDLFLLTQTLAGVPFDARVVDLGCGGSQTLKYLAALGYREILGIDLHITWRARLSLLWRLLRKRPAYRLRTGDITRTGLERSSVDVAVCISVIEHGVPTSEFIAEVARILRPGGILFVTTDYWPKTIKTPNRTVAFGLRWRIFDRDAIADLIATASDHRLFVDADLPHMTLGEGPVVWGGHEYTFIAMTFRKRE